MSNTEDDDLSERTHQDKLEGLDHYPPDRPLGAEDRGATDAEDSVAERHRREIPGWQGSGRPDDVAPLIDQGNESGVDDEPDSVAREARPEGTEFDSPVQDRQEVEPAEEAAMHITADPPMDDDDGYVDD